MTRKVVAYLVFFYAMYFLGHFIMTTAYGLGPSATTAAGVALACALMATLWKATGPSQGKKEMLWGIVSGFFLWCFFGEFLEQVGIVGLAEGKAVFLLLPFIIMTSAAVYKKLLPPGIQFSVVHFACVWLLHAILVHQVEVIKPLYPGIFSILLPVSGLAFLLIAIFMFFKTIRAGSERVLLAYLLPSFIFFWAAMETLQVMNIIPDYTCYAYWKNSITSGADASPWKDAVEGKVAQIRKCYAWSDVQAEKRALSLLSTLPFQGFIDHFRLKLELQMRGKEKKHMDEDLFYRVMEECFVQAAGSAFNRLLEGEVRQFKDLPLPDEKRHTDYASPPVWYSPREAVAEKIAFIKRHYPWETAQTRELAGYLLNRFSLQFLNGDDFIRKLDEKLTREKTDILSQELLCRVMKEYFAAASRQVFTNIRKMHAQ